MLPGLCTQVQCLEHMLQPQLVLHSQQRQPAMHGLVPVHTAMVCLTVSMVRARGWSYVGLEDPFHKQADQHQLVVLVHLDAVASDERVCICQQHNQLKCCLLPWVFCIWIATRL